jgi:hypothetical protein
MLLLQTEHFDFLDIGNDSKCIFNMYNCQILLFVYLGSIQNVRNIGLTY